MGEIAQRLVLDLALMPVGTPQEVGGVGLALVHAFRGGYMNRAVSACHTSIIPHTQPMSRAKTTI
jgi:hypothetical protein